MGQLADQWNPIKRIIAAKDDQIQRDQQTIADLNSRPVLDAADQAALTEMQAVAAQAPAPAATTLPGGADAAAVA